MSKCLKDIAFYVIDKIENSLLTSYTYVGVDNLLPDKAGIKRSDYVPKEGASTFFKKGDVLIGNIRPYFKKIWLATFEGGCSQDVLCIRAKEGVCPEFLYALLSQDNFFNYVMAGSKGSKMPRGDKIHVMSYPVVEINSTEAVGQFVIRINNKISNNNAINTELEAMAKDLYDYWFLQFEFPDENGKPYKSSGGKMVYNEELKREIPEGWHIDKVSTVARLYQPQTISENELVEDGRYFVYGANGIVGKYDAFNHKENEIAICCRGASCGEFIMTQPYSWITGNAMVMQPTSFCGKEFLFYGLSYKTIAPYITGSAQPQITRTNLENMSVMIPTQEVVVQFEHIALELRKKTQLIFSENQELASLRDFLLPLLMNGQVTFV